MVPKSRPSHCALQSRIPIIRIYSSGSVSKCEGTVFPASTIFLPSPPARLSVGTAVRGEAHTTAKFTAFANSGTTEPSAKSQAALGKKRRWEGWRKGWRLSRKRLSKGTDSVQLLPGWATQRYHYSPAKVDKGEFGSRKGAELIQSKKYHSMFRST